ncbi:MAG: redoxin family protein [Ktedonobacteraceae bacterium]|nr:redoxin family protein [Ktedonobacteraceae bacterium]MBA3822867.1 redoxin family protein [Ktedonobacterales bacterium]
MNELILFCRIVLILVFAWSSLNKFRDMTLFRYAVEGFHLVPERWLTPLNWGIPCAELATALLLLAPQTQLGGFLFGTLLLLAFSLAIFSVLQRKLTIICGCFGASTQAITALDILRNASFILCALGGSILILVFSLPQLLNPLTMTNILVIIAAAGYVLFFTQFAAFFQARRVARMASTGTLSLLRKNEAAPDFQLMTLTGEDFMRSSLSAARMVFLFITTTCPHCRQLMPELLHLAQRAQEAGYSFAFVSGNEREATLHYIAEFHIKHPVYLAPLPDNPTFRTLGFMNTPFYCLIDDQNIVRSAGEPTSDWPPWQELLLTWEQEISG